MPRKPLGRDTFIIRRAELVWSESAAAFYRDWDNSVDIVVEDAQVQPFRLAEKLNFEITKEREFSRTAMRFFAPADIDVDPNDKIIYRDQEYEVFGHLGVWTGFRGTADHVAFLARRREG